MNSLLSTGQKLESPEEFHVQQTQTANVVSSLRVHYLLPWIFPNVSMNLSRVVVPSAAGRIGGIYLRRNSPAAWSKSKKTTHPQNHILHYCVRRLFKVKGVDDLCVWLTWIHCLPLRHRGGKKVAKSRVAQILPLLPLAASSVGGIHILKCQCEVCLLES